MTKSVTESVFLGARPGALAEAGHQRIWHWRGWRVRYWFHPGPSGDSEGSLDAKRCAKAPILLIHGFGANLNQWRHNLPVLSAVAPVYAIDLLGFGDAEKAAANYGATLWAEQGADFIQQVIGQPVNLVGHSLGALVALTMARRHPDWVRQLLMVTVPTPASREDLVADWVADLARTVESLVASPLLLRPLFRVVRRRKFLERALRGIYIHPEKVDEELIDTFALPPQQRGAARTLCYLVNARSDPGFSPSVKGMLANLTQPTLILWGQQDRVIPSRLADGLADLSPQIQLQFLPDVGHCLYDEDPDTFNQVVTQWAT
ncbi:alpha/beta fold hydrolase [Leptolyngbya sp. BL0902]|uniref:alpha/beta fold hydrolase n=1 Tax=Leptolyngbya sp. BL0902 TaxID=1115757 RepID=UPI0018E72C47|nr:alpha/beta fold hydrolase [Leptolyngbya sp. BL0902]